MCCRRLVLSLLAASSLLAFSAADAGANAVGLRFLRPLPGRAIAGSVPVVAHTGAPTRTVRFYVDGRPVGTGRRPPFRLGGHSGFLNGAMLRPGWHRITVRVRYLHLPSARVSERVLVRGSSARATRGRSLVVRRPSAATQVARHVRPAAPRPKPVTRPRPRPRPNDNGAAHETPHPAPAPNPAVAGAAAAAPQSGLLFQTDFSGSGFSEWSDVQRVATDRIQSVPAPGVPGATAARFEVRNGDHVNGEQNSRAELAWENHLFSEGEVTSFSWSTMLAPDFPAPPNPQWADLLQWKNEGSGSPPLQVGVDNGNLDLTAGSQANWKTLWSTPVVRGQWVSFAATIKWSSDPSVGWVDFWFNGTKVVDHEPLATLYPGLRNYLKIGYYRSEDIVDTGVVYDRDLRVTQG